tara:strand:+ start:6161 stop:7039 length:879 start_codon:yes stop_codon:yes gene_type:complete
MSARPDQSIILSYQECKFCKSSDGFVFYDSHGYCYHCNEIWFGEDYDKTLEDMHRMHWTFRDDKTRVPDPDNYFGFVYIITNKKNHRKYIGCKQYWQMRHRKKYKPSNWRVYTSSSKELCEEIDKIGKRNFKFEIIQEYETKRGLHYYEQYYQMKYHVLTAVLEGTDQKEYYNKNVGGIRFYCPLETYKDPAYVKKQSEKSKARWADPEYRTKATKARCKGPYKITFNTGKEIVVDNLVGWGKDNNYYGHNLIQLVNKKPMKTVKGKKYYRKRVKDIVKVERVGEQTSDMGY